MADPAARRIQSQLRAAVLRTAEAQKRAAGRVDDAERVHRQHGSSSCAAACAEALRRAHQELRACEEEAASARIDLENHEEEERERRGADDPIGPQDCYTFKEIVELLYRGRRRATYGAVAEYLGAFPESVRGWIKQPGIDNCFIVNKATGEPTGYPAEAIHVELKKHPEILCTGKELLAWLQRPKGIR